MASQSGSYAALLAGGILAVAGFSGHSVKDVLLGRSSPLKGLISEPPSPGSNTGGSVIPSAWINQASRGALTAAGYMFPLGPGWTEERTDQGVDFAPSHTGAPIYSPGNARVAKVGAPGWPSGEKGVLLELLEGPLKGHFVYIYEAIQPTVKTGQIVKAGEQVGYGVFGETGIEAGFANAAGEPLSHGEYTEGMETVYGKKFREWLHSLAPRKKPSSTTTKPFKVKSA